jgi:hypothetical protein
MTIAARVRAAVNLARDLAEVVPPPAQRPHAGPEAALAWEGMMLTAANSLAATVDYDCEVLDAAVGPAIEVGVNPPWRVLLQIAQLEARAHAARADGHVSRPDQRRHRGPRPAADGRSGRPRLTLATACGAANQNEGYVFA